MSDDYIQVGLRTTSLKWLAEESGMRGISMNDVVQELINNEAKKKEQVFKGDVKGEVDNGAVERNGND